MSIIIQNITQEHVPEGQNLYVLRINDKRICNFTHERSYDGLAQCLRDAVDAVDRRDEDQVDLEDVIALMEGVEDHFRTGG